MVSYSKSGYESLFDEYKNIHGGFTIMICTTSQVGAHEDDDVEIGEPEELGSGDANWSDCTESGGSKGLSIVVADLSDEEKGTILEALAGPSGSNRQDQEEDQDENAGHNSPQQPELPTPSQALRSSTRRSQRGIDPPPARRSRGVSNRELANLEEYIDDPGPETGMTNHEDYMTYCWNGQWYLLEKDTPEEWTAGRTLRRFRGGRLIWQGTERGANR
ncbi:hypothetical protein PRZ48_008975 [Zasmidium cellare]|uniref:Uncharacterized protein n=1 Tax=Zasmidium cellare TaxID=395010 RepID=A0ABR0EH18_ZASCE|nr:hypothetical protein PRZ48_008975 [Zasmidium cellare]